MAAQAKKLLADQVYEHLLEQLLDGRLVPGEMLNRRAVAAELGMSVAPVLEAMLQLESEGLLETLPRKGTRVRLVREEDLRGQLILREAIECEVARLCCGRPIKENSVRLLKLARALDRAAGGRAATWELEIEFHRALAELADCRTLLRHLDRIMQRRLFYGIRQIVLEPARSPEDSHVALVEALKTIDPDKAERAMRTHVRAGRKLLIMERRNEP